MTTAITTLRAIGSFLLNKLAIIAIFCVLLYFYKHTQVEYQIELIYCSILLVGACVAAPLLRLLLFPEAAAYAESGELKKDLELCLGSRPARLTHYWYATGICYGITAAIVSTLHH